MAIPYHLSIVIPVYNEVAVLPQTYARLLTVMEPYDYELIFVDDGSQDASLSLLQRLASLNNRVAARLTTRCSPLPRSTQVSSSEDRSISGE